MSWKSKNSRNSILILNFYCFSYIYCKSCKNLSFNYVVMKNQRWGFYARCIWNAKCGSINTKYRTANTKYRSINKKYRTANVKYRSINKKYRTANVKYGPINKKYRTANVKYGPINLKQARIRKSFISDSFYAHLL